jgi:hypothetical protein
LPSVRHLIEQDTPPPTGLLFGAGEAGPDLPSKVFPGCDPLDSGNEKQNQERAHALQVRPLYSPHLVVGEISADGFLSRSGKVWTEGPVCCAGAEEGIPIIER